jgi:5-methylcytosine-specific restriction endonuclease McrA
MSNGTPPPPLPPGLRVKRRTGRASQALAKVMQAEAGGWVCWLCGGTIDPHATEVGARWSMDHVVPISRGGTNALDNLRPAHRACNSARGDRPDPAPVTPLATSQAWLS